MRTGERGLQQAFEAQPFRRKNWERKRKGRSLHNSIDTCREIG
jgi:hypothetical protein